MKPLSVRMQTARSQMMQIVNQAMRTHDIPAFIMEEIIADILSECRSMSKVEMLREIEYEQSVQSNNMGEQAEQSDSPE